MNKIMLVEDDADLCENIAALLEGNGFNVIQKEDASSALSTLDKVIPDIILSDILMPDINGYDFYRKYKEKYRQRLTPFVFMTARNDPASFRQAMNTGANDCIMKPFSSNDLLRTIEIQLEKKEQINGQIDEIIDNISKYIPHELRTPLVSILGYSQLILTTENELNKSDIVNMTERIHTSARRLHSRVEKFIQFADIPVSREAVEQKDFTSYITDKTISDIINQNYSTRERKGKISISVEPEEIQIPERYLRTVVNELLENAVKFSEPITPVIVTGRRYDENYELRIEDYGIGLEEYQIPLISTFQQFNRNEYQQEGNGLGLSLVKRILEMFKGSLNIESKKNCFTVVTITLPLY